MPLRIACPAQLPLARLAEAVAYHEIHLAITRETRDRAGEGRAYGTLGTAHMLMVRARRAAAVAPRAHVVPRACA